MKMERNALWILLLFSSIRLLSQGYIDETSKWKQYNYEWGASPSVPDTHEFTEYIYSKDTTINGVEYLVIRTEHTKIEAFDDVDGLDTVSVSQSFDQVYVREDGTKWYQFKAGEEALILDFNYEVGDTAYYDWFYGEYYIISSIEAFELAGETRKKFVVRLSNGPDFVLYEGVGSTRGFLRPFYDGSLEGKSRLECYQYQGEVFLPNSSFTDCEIEIVSRVENRANELGVRIYPNPVEEILHIELKEKLEAYRIRLFDLHGKQLLEEQLLDTDYPVNHQINLSRFPPGIFLLKIDNGFRELTKRIVKL